jgi:hypothetical protein
LSEQELDDEAAMDLPDREEMSVVSSPGDFMTPIDPTPIHFPVDPLPTPE